MEKILVLDNYDSFTYNLVHYVRQLSSNTVDVFRNDEITLDDVGKYQSIILSPGPGLPSEAGIMPELIRRYSPTCKILGVCLGQQAIGEVFGGKLTNLSSVYHGVSTPVKVTEVSEPLFNGFGNTFEVGRYHSWVVDREGFPQELQITCLDENGFVMGLKHKYFNVRGVQFHPESILTPNGLQMINNWLNHC